MKRYWIVFLLLMAVILTGCQSGQASQPPTEKPTEATQAPTEPATEPPTEPPTKPPAPDLSWLAPERTSMTYEAFFGENRRYEDFPWYWERWNYVTDFSEGLYFLKTDADGWYVHTTDPDRWDENPLHHVPDSEKLTKWEISFCDGRYAYCFCEEFTLLKVDLLTGQSEEIPTGITAVKRVMAEMPHPDVLYILAEGGEYEEVYRLYLPTMTLDLLYGEIPLDTPKEINYVYDRECLFPKGTREPLAVTYINPAFNELIQKTLADKESPYFIKYGAAPFLWEYEGLEDVPTDHINAMGHLICLLHRDYKIPYSYSIYCEYDSDSLTIREDDMLARYNPKWEEVPH